VVAILFDLEGTLVDSLHNLNKEELYKERLAVKEKLIELGVPKAVLKGLVRHTLLRNRSFDWVESNCSQDSAIQFKAELDAFMEDIEMTNAKVAKVFHDTHETLSKLAAEGVEVGLVTNTSRIAAKYMIDKFGLEGFFNVIITRNDAQRLKPNPVMIQIAISKMNSEVRWLVGDTIYDAKAAENSGLKSILIRRDGDQPNFKHDYFIDNLSALLSIIKNDN
jgi:phosphoglycolate phosphatase-like HAD superfamily hydrolase